MRYDPQTGDLYDIDYYCPECDAELYDDYEYCENCEFYVGLLLKD